MAIFGVCFVLQEKLNRNSYLKIQLSLKHGIRIFMIRFVSGLINESWTLWY